jgi:hypothetical protein
MPERFDAPSTKRIVQIDPTQDFSGMTLDEGHPEDYLKKSLRTTLSCFLCLVELPRSPLIMPRLLKTATLFAVACLLPFLALHAQQPPSADQADPPTAKDAVKPAEKKEGTPKSSNDPIERIKAEGQNRSQVMSTLSYLTDVIGPRLTGSPNMKRANEWTRDELKKWGLENAQLEPWGTFGRGWTLKRFSAQVIEPQCIPLIACPRAWSPGLDGLTISEVVYFDAKTEADLARFKGKLKGAIVLSGPPRPLAARFEPLATRLTDTDLLTLADAPEPGAGRRGPGRRPQPVEGPVANAGPNANANTNAGSATGAGPSPGPESRFQMNPEQRARAELARKKLQFLTDEGAALVLDPSMQGDGGTLFVAQANLPVAPPAPGSGTGPGARRVSPWDKDAPKTIPQIVVAAEHYNRMVRMIERGESLKLAVELSVQFLDDDLTAYNTVAEIPGTDLKHELVMLGGHMDSWHGGTGATDNAAGVAVAMEAVRILKTLDLKPRRTIRIALWTGEEQGLLGSRGYVTKHFGRRPEVPGIGANRPSASEGGATPKESSESSTTPEFETFSAYFNLDNGTGKIRGVYLQGNEAVRPIFRKWLQPFREMGAGTLTIGNTGGTDHQSFDGIGLPGFQFIQDRIDYGTRTHHSNQDVYDRIQADDMKQAAVIMASFVYNAAMADEKLPRKPKPEPRNERVTEAR